MRKHGALVLVSPPGSGKTTRVPPAILESGLAAKGRIVVLQPRRIAARAAAARIASEQGWTVGREVGYQVRFENRTSPETRLHIVTEGILTRILQGNPFLEGISAVVLDEFHERSLHADLALALLREIRKGARDDLRVAVMSATLDPAPISEFLGGCPVIVAEGRPFPVEVRYLDRPDVSPLPATAAKALREAWSEASGHALVFLPGIGEIQRAARELEGFAPSAGAVITPLHGSLSLDEQQLALSPSSRRKIVLSTNIAETSLTIEGVDLVIDGGHARILRNDPRHGIDRLEVARISKHSAEQRSGRAGRLGPGKAIRLWTRAEHTSLPDEETPEIRRVDLASTVLELRSWGVADPGQFQWFEAPDPARLERAEDLLLQLGAVTKKHGPLTATGKAMLQIPAHPRISRMLVAACLEGRLEDGASLAALIEERDIVPLSFSSGPAPQRKRAPSQTGPSDLLLRLDLFEEAERQGLRREALSRLGVDAAASRAVSHARQALLRSAKEAMRGDRRLKIPPQEARGASDSTLLRVLLLGYPDRVARRRAKGSDRGRMVGGRGVVLSPESVVRDDELFLALELDESTRGERLEAKVRMASAVRREWIVEAFPSSIREAVEAYYDTQAEKVRATATTCFLDLPLEEPRERRPAPEEAAKLLREGVIPRAEEVFLADDGAAPWIVRVRSLREWMPELELPALDAEGLGEALAEACSGKSSLAEVRSCGLLGLLKGAIPYEKLRAIEEHAPESLLVPSGKHIRLSYEPGRPPVLAVRLQELFGLGETPTVAAGRIRVLLHLLGPNFRPVQITQDLKSFWNNTYEQVRKDLRARYPKHAWPEDPWTAQPQARPRRKKG